MASSELVPAGDEPQLPSTRDAASLLSKPTLDLTDEEVEIICADLRKRREQFLQGVQDKPKRAALPAPDRSPEAKAARTAQLLGELDL